MARAGNLRVCLQTPAVMHEPADTPLLSSAFPQPLRHLIVAVPQPSLEEAADLEGRFLVVGLRVYPLAAMPVVVHALADFGVGEVVELWLADCAVDETKE